MPKLQLCSTTNSWQVQQLQTAPQLQDSLWQSFTSMFEQMHLENHMEGLKHVLLPSYWAQCSPEPWSLGSNHPAESADAVAQPGWNSPASCRGSDDHIHQPRFQGHLEKKGTMMLSSKEASSPFNTSTSKGSKTSSVITATSHIRPTELVPSQSIHRLRV